MPADPNVIKPAGHAATPTTLGQTTRKINLGYVALPLHLPRDVDIQVIPWAAACVSVPARLV